MLSRVTASHVRKAQRALDAASTKLNTLERETKDYFAETKDIAGLRLLTLLLARPSAYDGNVQLYTDAGCLSDPRGNESSGPSAFHSWKASLISTLHPPVRRGLVQGSTPSTHRPGRRSCQS